MKSGHSFPREQRLKSSKDIRQVFDTGEKYVGRSMIIFAARVPDRLLRAGFIVSKRVGQAVLRNRVKRLMREAFRLQKHLFGSGLWLVFLAKAGPRQWNQSQLMEEVARLAQRIKTE